MILEQMVREDSQEAYTLLVSRTEELITRGTGQYTAPFPPLEVFNERVERGQNWLVRVDHKIAGIVSLLENGVGEEWPEVYRKTEHLWMASLFVGRDFKRMGIGDSILRECQARAHSRGVPLFLDCYLDSGFLETYYRDRGFVTIDRKTFIFGRRSFNAALMKYPE